MELLKLTIIYEYTFLNIKLTYLKIQQQSKRLSQNKLFKATLFFILNDKHLIVKHSLLFNLRTVYSLSRDLCYKRVKLYGRLYRTVGKDIK
jgi:hypothetical protein